MEKWENILLNQVSSRHHAFQVMFPGSEFQNGPAVLGTQIIYVNFLMKFGFARMIYVKLVLKSLRSFPLRTIIYINCFGSSNNRISLVIHIIIKKESFCRLQHQWRTVTLLVFVTTEESS